MKSDVSMGNLSIGEDIQQDSQYGRKMARVREINFEFGSPIGGCGDRT